MKLTLKEMNGLLNGKCLPSDLIVGETLAEYLVRKFTGLEQKLAESQREFRAADATIENLQMQLEKLAAENAGLKGAIVEHSQCFTVCKCCGTENDCSHDDVCRALNETPATDAIMAEVRAQGVEMFSEQQRSFIGKPSKNDAASSYSSREAINFADQLRKGAAS